MAIIKCGKRGLVHVFKGVNVGPNALVSCLEEFAESQPAGRQGSKLRRDSRRRKVGGPRRSRRFPLLVVFRADNGVVAVVGVPEGG